jgi:hypothetical protein
MATLEDFDNMLNETHEMVRIAGCDFLPSEILKNCDPIAYNVYASDWLSFEEDEEE